MTDNPFEGLRQTLGKKPLLDETKQGLFSVDANLPDSWAQTVRQETQTYNDIRTGRAFQPVEVDDRGIPVTWDYRTSKLGPWGENLPNGAQGWKPTGEADFGPGIGGWWKRTLHNIYDDREEDNSPAVTEILQGLFDTIGQAHAKKATDVTSGKQTEGQANMGILGQTALATMGATVEIIKNFWSGLEGPEVTPITAIPRILGETIRTAGDVLQGAAEFAEEKVVGPRLLADVELAQKYNIISQEDFKKWEGWTGQIAVFPLWLRVGTAMLTGKIPVAEYYAAPKEFRNQQAAKIAYTAWKDSAVKGEFLRRVRAGEDPRLLALDLEDPIDEMVLEFVFDPLNLLDVWYSAGKAASYGMRLSAKLNRGRAALGLEEVVKAIRVAADAGDFENVTAAIKKIGPLLDDARRVVLTGERDVATSRGIFKALQTFNRSDRGEDFANIFSDTLRAVGHNPDEVARAWTAGTKLINPDDAVKLEGLTELADVIRRSGGRLDADLMFSNEAMRSYILFNDLISGADGTRDFSKIDGLFDKAQEVVNATGDVVRDFKKGAKLEEGERVVTSAEKLAGAMAEQMGNIIDRRFPTLTDAIKQNEEYLKVLEKAGGDVKAPAVQNFLRKRPAANQEISNAMKRLDKFHQGAQKWFYRPAATAQSAIFMGMSPGYMYRNRIGNAVALLSDQGIGPAFRAMVPRAFGGNESAIKHVREWLGDIPAGARRTQAGAAASFELSDKASGWGPILRTAQEDEKLARLHVAGKVIRRVMKNALHPKRALQGIDEILESASDVKQFTRLSYLHKGDLNATIKAFKEIKGTRVARTLEGIDDYTMYFIEAHGLEDDLFRLLKDETLGADDIIRKLDDLEDEWGEYGLATAREAAALDVPAAEFAEDTEFFAKHFGEGLQADMNSDEFLRKVNARYSQIEAEKDAAQQAFMMARKEAENQITHDLETAGNMVPGKKKADAMTAARNAQRQVQDTFDDLYLRLNGELDKLWTKARNSHHAFLKDVRRVYDQIGGMAQDQLYQLWSGGWKGIPRLGPDLADPGLLTPRTVKDALWSVYRRDVDLIYLRAVDKQVDGYRDINRAAVAMMKGEKEIKEIGGLTAKADRAGAIRRIMDRGVLDKDTGEMVAHVTRSDFEQVLPQYYEQVLSASRTRAAGENLAEREGILDILKRFREKIRTDPNLSAADAWTYLDEDMRKAFKSVVGPRWRQAVEFMVGDFDVGDANTVLNKIAGVGGAVGTLAREALSNEVVLQHLDDINPGGTWTNLSGRTRVVLQAQDNTIVKIARRDAQLPPHPNIAAPIDSRWVSDMHIETYGKLNIEDITQADVDELRTLIQGPKGNTGWVWMDDRVENVGKAEDGTLQVLDSWGVSAPPGIEAAQAVEGGDDAARLQSVVDRIKAGNAAETPTFKLPIVGPQDAGTVSAARYFHESYPTALDVLGNVKKVVKENFQGGIEGRVLDDITEAKLQEWLPQARGRVERAKIEASRQAVITGDFAMHNYGKRMGIDLLASYIFPYQFWYSRSYAKWMQRAVRHPGMAAAYFRYRDTLAKQHAGLPDWWKYQLNTNELLGLDSDEPLWFNLEALVSPLHGLTGIDFTDPKRRVDGWGSWMEDLNKFGPTMWAPYQLALIMKYHFQGEDEAAARWAGRILPFSKAVRDATALADPKGLGIEIDPYVHLFGGGIEAYERGRVGRQLGIMMDEGKYSPADIVDATYNQSGEIWDAARARTIRERAPNIAMALAPFFFGAGAKPRNVKDQEIDRMYSVIDGLMKNRENMNESEYRASWQQARQQYPFMDAVLMSKKSGPDRDEALAWNVLSRIPPGMTAAIAEQAGVSRAVLDSFYASKGDLTEMTEADRLRFMGTILEIGGLLDIPEAATQAEWNMAKNLYKDMRAAGQIQFGDDIWDLVDLYYASFDSSDPDAGRNFLRANPRASDALDWQQAMIQNTPLLAAYYTSDERIRQFYKSQMYQTAEQLFGEDLWDKFEIYSRLKDLGEDKAAKEFWNDNLELGGYMQFKEDELPKIEEKVAHFGTIIPESKPPAYRHEQYDVTPMSPNVDQREASIVAQVNAYAEAYSNYSGRRTDIRTLLRAQADEIWPNTRAMANTYYELVEGGSADKAAAYLQEHEELQPRIMWEFDKIQRLDLATVGELFQSAGGAPGLTQQFEAPPGIDPNTPLGRLYNDPQGIPEHIWQAYLAYGQQ